MAPQKIHVEMVDARVRQIQFKDDQAVLTIGCSLNDLKGSRKEIDKLANANFLADVVIDGRLEQLTLETGKDSEPEED
jgi:hypothetical protein